MTKLNKLDLALDAIAEHFFQPMTNRQGVVIEDENKKIANRFGWAQRDVLQAIAWKANSALDRANGPDARMAALKVKAEELVNKPQTDSDYDFEAIDRVAQDIDFWADQQMMLEGLMTAASDALVRAGHEAYVRQDLTKQGNRTAPTLDDKKRTAAFERLGLAMPKREDTVADDAAKVKGR